MTQTKTSFFALFLLLSVNNLMLCMDDKKIIYPKNIRAKALRKHFEKRTQEELYKKETLNYLQQDPEFYKKGNRIDLESLQTKLEKAHTIALKKLFWGAADSTLGVALIGLGSWAVKYGFREATHSNDPHGWRGWSAFWGTLCVVPGTYFAWQGAKKIYKNRRPGAVIARMQDHMKANKKVKDYLDTVFQQKESDDEKED